MRAARACAFRASISGKRSGGSSRGTTPNRYSSRFARLTTVTPSPLRDTVNEPRYGLPSHSRNPLSGGSAVRDTPGAKRIGDPPNGRTTRASPAGAGMRKVPASGKPAARRLGASAAAPGSGERTARWRPVSGSRRTRTAGPSGRSSRKAAATSRARASSAKEPSARTDSPGPVSGAMSASVVSMVSSPARRTKGAGAEIRAAGTASARPMRISRGAGAWAGAGADARIATQSR